MILDILSRWKLYQWDQEGFKAGFTYLEQVKPDVKDGKYELNGDRVFAMVQTYDTRPLEVAEFEAHRQYADIQYIIEGDESIYWMPQSELTVTKAYEPDAEMYKFVQPATQLIMTPGRFCVFYPRDAHAPSLVHKAVCKVRKVVVKVRVG